MPRKKRADSANMNKPIGDEPRKQDDSECIVETSVNIDALTVHLPRGYSAIVRYDPVTGSIRTGHAGLCATMQRGVRDWDGRRIFPRDGRLFLKAFYDYLFVNGYAVCPVRASE
jgi:hypothetical protein